MGIVHPDRPDVFISYARVDDAADKPPGWVTCFVDELERVLRLELGPVTGSSLDVFRDIQLSVGAMLLRDLKQTVENSAALMVILSKAYLDSVWTPAEHQWFIDHVDVRNLDALGNRIFPVEFSSVPRQAQFGVRNFVQFWYEDTAKKRPRTLGWPKPVRDYPPDREFYNLLRDLGEDVAKELMRQKNAPVPLAADVAAAAVLPAAPTGPTVYLAPTTADLQQQRERFRRYLELEGLQVGPSRAYVDDAKFNEQVDADLASAVLFVQLLSGDPGSPIAGSNELRVAALAARAAAKGKPMLLWRSANEALPADIPPAHRGLLDQASTADLEVFKQSVVDRYKKLQEGERPKTGAAGYDCTVLVNFSEEVRPQVNQIRQELDQRHAYAVLPANLGAVDKNRLALEGNLADCDGLLLVARATGTWIESQLLQTRKALARRDRPLPVFQWTQPGNPNGPDFDAFLNGLRGGGPGV